MLWQGADAGDCEVRLQLLDVAVAVRIDEINDVVHEMLRYYPGGFAPPDPPAPSLAGPPSPSSPPAGAPAARLRIPGGFAPPDPPAPSLAGPPSPRSPPAGAPAAPLRIP